MYLEERHDHQPNPEKHVADTDSENCQNGHNVTRNAIHISALKWATSNQHSNK
jgi:hypothetical protein